MGETGTTVVVEDSELFEFVVELASSVVVGGSDGGDVEEEKTVVVVESALSDAFFKSSAKTVNVRLQQTEMANIHRVRSRMPNWNCFSTTLMKFRCKRRENKCRWKQCWAKNDLKRIFSQSYRFNNNLLKWIKKVPYFEV